MLEVYLYLFSIHTFIHTTFFCTVGRCKCWTVCFFCFWAQICSLILVFGQFGWPLKGLDLVRLVQANLLIWADSAGWTGWEVLSVHDEWKMALVMVMVEVERVKMAVVCPSGDT